MKSNPGRCVAAAHPRATQPAGAGGRTAPEQRPSARDQVSTRRGSARSARPSPSRFPAGSGDLRDLLKRLPGLIGQASRHHMVTTTSAARTTSSVERLRELRAGCRLRSHVSASITLRLGCPRPARLSPRSGRRALRQRARRSSGGRDLATRPAALDADERAPPALLLDLCPRPAAKAREPLARKGVRPRAAWKLRAPMPRPRQCLLDSSRKRRSSPRDQTPANSSVQPSTSC